MVVERGVRGLRPRWPARSLCRPVSRLDVGIKSRLPVGGRHRPRLLSSEAVCAGFERVAPQQRRRHFQRCLGRGGIAAHRGKALGVAIHDFNRDGCIDLFVANDSMQQYLFRNTGRGTFDEVALEAGVAYDDDGQELCRDGRRLRGLRQRWVAGRIRHDAEPGALRPLPCDGTRRLRIRVARDGRRPHNPSELRMGDEVRGLRQRRRAAICSWPRVTYSTRCHARARGSTIFSRRSCCVTRRRRSSMYPRRSGRHSPGRPPAAALPSAMSMTTGTSTSSSPTSTPSRRVLRNDGGNANHWLTVSLRGTRSNRDGIGAVVGIVDEKGRSQSAICSTASSYQSGNDRRVHFGLADVKQSCDASRCAGRAARCRR